MNLYVGTSGYSYKEWKGSFYPADLPTKRMLSYYGEHFGAVEVNYTFKQVPKTSVLETWAAEVPADFKFVLKAPQRRLTHFQRLKNTDDSMSYFFKVAQTLEHRLGPVLFQLPPNFQKNTQLLDAFLAALPDGCRAAFEFRHQSWFDDETLGVLRQHQAALCIAEAEAELEIPFAATASWGYVRLRKPDYTTAELKQWLKRIRDQEWRDAFVFFKHEDEGKGPKFARKFLDLVG